MSPEPALLAAVREQPDDDLPRLAYADWCEETGDADRAAFIRAQVARARLGDGDSKILKLRRQENALLKAHPEWAQAGPGALGALHRGFLEEVTLSAEQFLAQAAALVERHPIRRVTLQLGPEVALVRQAADCPALAAVRELAVQRAPFSEGGPGDAGVAVLLGSPHLGRLRALELVTCWLGDGTATALSAADLPALEVLDLRNSRITHRGVAALAAAKGLRKLKRLVLHRNPVGPEGAEVLADSKWKLESLDLMRTQLQTAGVRALTATAFLAGVRELSLEWNNLRVQAAGCVARCPNVASLRWLNFNRNRLEDAGAEALAGSPHLAGLLRLGLRRNRLTAAGIEAVGGSPHLAGVRLLELGGNGIDDKAKKRLRARFGQRFGRF